MAAPQFEDLPTKTVHEFSKNMTLVEVDIDPLDPKIHGRPRPIYLLRYTDTSDTPRMTDLFTISMVSNFRGPGASDHIVLGTKDGLISYADMEHATKLAAPRFPMTDGTIAANASHNPERASTYYLQALQSQLARADS
jgi:hypothetical protein